MDTNVDIVTFSKLFNTFNYHKTCFIGDNLKENEIDELTSLGIIKDVGGGLYNLKRKKLYSYSKTIRNNGDYELAIFILNYLMGYKDKEKDNWFTTYNYQLFKIYFLKGNYYKAYKCLNIGFEHNSMIYPALVNMMNYLLRDYKELLDMDDDLKEAFINNDFKKIEEYYKSKFDNITKSHQNVFNMVIDKVNEVSNSYIEEIKKLIDRKDYKILVSYISKIKYEHQSNKEIDLIGKIAFIIVKLEEKSNVLDDDLLMVINLLDSYIMPNHGNLYDEFNISEDYEDVLNSLLKKLYSMVLSSDYNKYLDNKIKRVLNKVKNNKRILILDNISDGYNSLVYKSAILDKDIFVEINRKNDKRIIIKSKNKNDKETITIDIIKNLYNNHNIKDCLNKCITWINNDDNCPSDVYYYAGLCNLSFGNKETANTFFDLHKTINIDDEYNSILKEAAFYGIHNFKEIIDFASKYNVQVDLAGLNYSLNEEQINRLNLLISRYCYLVGETKLGDYYYNAGNDNKERNMTNIFLKKEIDNPNSYKDLDYYAAKDIVKQLVKKNNR